MKLHVTNHLVSSFLRLVNVVVCVLIIYVFKHIMGKMIDVEINEKWGELGPLVIQLARKEVDNQWVQDLLVDLPEDLPEGRWNTCTYNFACCIVHMCTCTWPKYASACTHTFSSRHVCQLFQNIHHV